MPEGKMVDNDDTVVVPHLDVSIGCCRLCKCVTNSGLYPRTEKCLRVSEENEQACLSAVTTLEDK